MAYILKNHRFQPSPYALAVLFVIYLCYEMNYCWSRLAKNCSVIFLSFVAPV